MRLLNVATFEIEQRDVLRRRRRLEQNGKYATVSHGWTENEISSQRHKQLEETGEIQKLEKPESIKDDIPHSWIDTCCIATDPSADPRERPQAINPMFRWYREAEVCYTFLHDVSDNESDHYLSDLESGTN